MSLSFTEPRSMRSRQDVVVQAAGVALSFKHDGARHFSRAAQPMLADIVDAVADLSPEQAGVRIWSLPALQSLLGFDGAIGSIAVDAIGPAARPVRAILFDKTERTNWSLAWHQDRTICVKRKLPVAGFDPWTVKAGMQHVAPPSDLLHRMVTLRVHLDDVSMTNAPLLIAPGSHRAGRVPESEIDAVVRRCGTYACLAQAGDVWLYATPILHASARATVPARRRVLQIDYSAEELPGGLEWLGI